MPILPTREIISFAEADNIRANITKKNVVKITAGIISSSLSEKIELNPQIKRVQIVAGKVMDIIFDKIYVFIGSGVINKFSNIFSLRSNRTIAPVKNIAKVDGSDKITIGSAVTLILCGRK